MALRTGRQDGGFPSGLLTAQQDLFVTTGQLLGLPVETDEALYIHSAQPVARVDEADSSLPVTGEKILLGELADGTEDALPILLGGLPILVTTTIENNSAPGFTRRKVKSIGPPVTEADVAQAVGYLRRQAIALASETDTAVSLTLPGLIPLITAIESELAQMVPRQKLYSPQPVVETDAARTLNRVIQLVSTLETDLAFSLFEDTSIIPHVQALARWIQAIRSNAKRVDTQQVSTSVKL